MDLIYKIYSVYLYDNGLAHDWVFFYNRTKGFTGEVKWDAPYTMFGSSSFCANNQIFNMDKSQPDFNEMSVRVMKSAAQSEGIDLIRVKDFLILEKIGTTHMPNYNAYQILWNETKSGFNPHQFEVMGVWREGSSQYSSYRIWEEVAEREKTIRDNKLKLLGA